jgi:soluble lytic murein transglycosylase-like protein
MIRHFASLSYGARGARVPSNYVRALVLGESSARKHATSHKGARGLTQIMPATGQAAIEGLLEMHTDFLYVEREALESFTAMDLYDPAMNLLIASYLTAGYHRQYGGSSELVTAAWNAGPQAVRRHGNTTPPYKETHQLIDRVHGYMRFFESGPFTATVGHHWNSPGWNRAFDSNF